MTEYENGNDENGLGAADEKKDFACACNSSSVGTAGVFGGGGFAERSSLKFKCESSGSSSQVCWRQGFSPGATVDEAGGGQTHLCDWVPDQSDFVLFRGSLCRREAVLGGLAASPFGGMRGPD